MRSNQHSGRTAASRSLLDGRRAASLALVVVAGLMGPASAQTAPPATPPTTPPVTPPSRPVPPTAPGGAPGRPTAPPSGAPGQPGQTPPRRPGGTPVEERVEGLRPRRVPPKMQFTGGPAIWFDVLDYDFGPMTNAETRNCVFSFTNVGDSPLTIMDVVPACGCTRPTFDKGKVFQPGEVGKIAVAFTPPTGGHQAKSLKVMTDARNPGEVVSIRVIGEVETVLSFLPKSADLGEVRQGQTHEGTIEIKADAPETIFESVTVNPRSQGMELAFATPGPHKGTATLKYKLAPTIEWGLYQSGIGEILTKGTLENGQEITKKLPFRLLAKVVDDVKATDFVIRCGVHNYNETFTGSSIVYGDKPFEVVNVQVEPLPKGSKGAADMDYTVDVVPSDDPEKKGWKFILNCKSGESRGFVSGKVKFGTKLAGSDQIVPRTLGIHGFVVEPGGQAPAAFLQQPGAAGATGAPAAPTAPAAR